MKKIDNLKDFYQERLNQLSEKINEDLSIDELEEIHKEFSYLTEICKDHLPTARRLRELIEKKIS